MAANNTTEFRVLLSKNELLVFNVMLPLFSILGLLVNAVVIFVIVSERSMRHTIANIYIVNLAFADILVLVFGIPLWLFQLVEQSPNTASCQATFGITVVSSAISVFTLALISYDRYYSVTRPFAQINGRNKAYRCLAFIWAYAIILSLPFFIGWESTNQPIPVEFLVYCAYTRMFRQEMLLVNFLSGAIVMIMNSIFYVKLLSIAKYHAKRIQEDLNSSSLKSRCKKQKSLKATKTLGIILSVMLLCWVPFFVVASLDVFHFDHGITTFTIKLLGTFTYLNSILNPIIYTFMTRAFKKSITQKLKKRNLLCALTKPAAAISNQREEKV